MDAPCFQAVEECGVEVQPGGGGGDGTGRRRPDRLVPALVVGIRGVPDVRRQGYPARALQHAGHVDGKLDGPALARASDHSHLDGRSIALQHDRRPWCRGVARADARQSAAWPGDALDEQLDLATSGFPAQQARLDHPRVVEDEQVAGRQELGQVGDRPVREPARCRHQEATGGPLRQWPLGDELRRQVVMEVGTAHGIRQNKTPAGGAGFRARPERASPPEAAMRLRAKANGAQPSNKCLTITYFHKRAAHYHRRRGVSRSCSGWEGVVPPCYGHQA